MSKLNKKDKRYIKYAWLSLLTAVLSWLPTTMMNWGLDIVAVSLASVALKRLPKKYKDIRRIAWYGASIGVLKILYIVMMIFQLFLKT